MARRIVRSPKRRTLAGRLFRWLLAALAVFLLLSATAVLVMRWVPPPSSSFMLQAQWLQGRQVDYRWKPLLNISAPMRLAVIAAEDQRFPYHRGVDFDAIQAALDQYQAGAPLRGASTLSQQVAKNLFLWSGRDWARKGLEAYFAVLIDLLWPKDRILEVYLNIAEFGPGIYGVEAASQRYYRHSSTRLTQAQAVRLAAVLPNPVRYSPLLDNHHLEQRSRWIAQQMEQLGGTAFLERHGL